MTPEQSQKIQPIWEKYVRDETEKMIRRACGIEHGQNYKKYVPLMELINYKIDAGSIYGSRSRQVDRDTLKFQKFIEVVDEFVILVASQWPFIDLEGIDLTWTSDQIVEKVVDMYRKVPVLKYDGIQPPYKDNSESIKKIVNIFEKNIGPHVNKRKKINKNLELQQAIVEARGIEVPMEPTRWGVKANYDAPIVKQTVDNIVESIISDIKKEFPNDDLVIYSWWSINKVCKQYQEKHKF